MSYETSAGGIMQKVASIDETARILKCGRNTAYELVASGRLKHVRYGRRIVVPLVAIERFLEDEMRTSGDERQTR